MMERTDEIRRKKLALFAGMVQRFALLSLAGARFDFHFRRDSIHSFYVERHHR